MSAIALANVSVSALKVKKLEDGRKIVQATIAFGDGALTYPAGGIPISKGALACPVVIDSFKVDDSGAAGYVYTFDKANSKIRIFQSPGHSHSLLLKDAVQADGATTRVNAASNKLGANTGSDISVAGGGANGGVQAVADGSLVELSGTVAPAAQSLKVTVIGY